MRPWVIFLLFLCAPSRLFSQNQGPSVASAEPKAAASLTALVQEAMDRNPEIQATKRAWVPRAALRNNSASISRPPESATSLRWGSSAKLHRGLAKVSGTLIIDGAGVEFRPDKGSTIRWPFVEIQTLDLWPRRIVLIGYEKRGRFRPGVRRYRFDPGSEMPPSVAAKLLRRVGRPVRNGNPQPEASSIATLSAHHRTGLGGTKSNGTLRFGEWGIDYVTSVGKDSRSWRWADIQTLSNTDPYHLTVFGYLETYSFDLKEPLKQKTYDGLNDEVYRHHEELRERSDTGKQGVAQ